MQTLFKQELEWLYWFQTKYILRHKLLLQTKTEIINCKILKVQSVKKIQVQSIKEI